MRDVKEIVKAMLKENTGRALLDSGDAYGRNWERNQDRDFDNEPQVTVDMYGEIKTTEDVDYTINVYHYLTNALTFDEFTEAVNDELHRLRTLEQDDDSEEYPHWSEECVGVVERLIEEANDGEDDENPMCGEITEKNSTVNTYNHDSHLSQVLLFNTFTFNGDYYVLLQVHGGCDVRGGYTDAVCFKLPDTYGCPVMPMEDVYGDVDGVAISNSYDGFHLYCDDDDNDLYEEYVPCTEESKFNLYLMEC